MNSMDSAVHPRTFGIMKTARVKRQPRGRLNSTSATSTPNGTWMNAAASTHLMLLTNAAWNLALAARRR